MSSHIDPLHFCELLQVYVLCEFNIVCFLEVYYLSVPGMETQQLLDPIIEIVAKLNCRGVIFSGAGKQFVHLS